jgi:putative ABC transport system permease protein
MFSASQLARRLGLFIQRRSFERRLEEELRFHMDMVTSRHLALGSSEAEACTLTQREFGSMNRFKEEIRDARGMTLMDDLWRDVRLAVRALLRTPGFTAIALLTFALGIGANTAIFSLVNAVLLRPLPYPNADRIVRVFESLKDNPEPSAVSYMNWRDWQQQSTSFDALGGYSVNDALLGGEQEPEPARDAAVTANVFQILGARPLLGRTFAANEEVKGKNHVVVLSEALWRRRFGSDPFIVGKSIPLEDEPYLIIGVMPASFNFPAGPARTDVWTPFEVPEQALDARSRGWHWMRVVGLLKPGVSVERADREMKQIARRLELQYPDQQVNRSTITQSLQESLVGKTRPVLVVLLGAVFLVLLIACANVANLLVARNASRQSDTALRTALGAGRGRLARQFLTESVVLALFGAGLGLGVARLSLHLLTKLTEASLPISGDIPLDRNVLLVLLLSSLACGLAFGIAPVLQLEPGKMRYGLGRLTVRTTASGEMRRLRNGHVIAQVALSLMLLVGAGLLLRGFVALRNTDPGLDPERVLTAMLAVPHSYAASGTETQHVLRPLLDRVRAIPGVRAAGTTSLLPIDQTGSDASFWVDTRPWPKRGDEPLIEVRNVSPQYFTTMNVPIRAGRGIEEDDDSTSVMKCVVNEAVVRLLFPNENPLGHHLLQGNPEQHQEFEIIGVVADVKQSGLNTPARPEVYMSYADQRANFSADGAWLVVKTAVPELSIVPQVRAAVHDVAPDVALSNVRPMMDVIEHSLDDRKLTLMLFALFALVALVLAASGLYGVIYYLVTQRTREIGIRVALGADRTRVVWLVLSQGATLVGMGIAVGVAGALALSRLLGAMLYGVGARDPVTFASVPVLLALVALVATLIPAWRAARVDPVIALRAE